MRRSQEFEKNILLHLGKVNAVEQSDSFKSLQKWQAQRLLNTHMQLYKQSRFKPAMDFFKDELYSADHFHIRNKQLMKAIPLMCNTLPVSILAIVQDAAELHSLSLALDSELLKNLADGTKLKTMTLKDWEKAYCLCNNQSARARQIDLIEGLGNALARIVKKPMIKPLLNWAKYPAKLAGYEEIHRFVCSGFLAFEHLEEPNDFLIPVIRTERNLSAEWFSQAEIDPSN